MFFADTPPQLPAEATEEPSRSPLSANSTPTAEASSSRGSSSSSSDTTELLDSEREDITNANNTNNDDSDEGDSDIDEGDEGELLVDNDLDLSSLDWKSEVKTHTNSNKTFSKAGRVKGIRNISNFSPLSIFKLLFPIALASKIADETNTYAKNEIRKTMSASRTVRWIDTSACEIYRFIGICIYMALEPLRGGYREYWRKEEIGCSTGKSLGRFMKIGRYIDLRKYLHFCDNSKQNTDRNSSEYDKLYKIRLVLDAFNKYVKMYFHLGDSASIDEAMSKFFGRTFLRQYMPNKPVKYGFKLWCMCDPTTGYFYVIDVYTGKRPGEPAVKGLGAQVVLDLVDKSGISEGAVIVYDRFFGGVEILLKLLERGLYGISTIMTNRKGFPKELVALTGKESRGTIISATCPTTKMSAVAWMDSKPVYVIGTTGGVSGDECERRVRGRGMGGRKEIFPRPSMISIYNKLMGGVDLGDKLRGFLDLETAHQFHKWYKKLFMTLLGMFLVNAYIIYAALKSKQSTPTCSKKEHTDFLYELQAELVVMGRADLASPKTPDSERTIWSDHTTSQTRSGGSTSSTSSSRSEVLQPDTHNAVKIDDEEKNVRTGKNSYFKSRECVYCKSERAGKVSRTIYKCKECDLPLCCNGNNCFYLYHVEPATIKELFPKQQYKGWSKKPTP